MPEKNTQKPSSGSVLPTLISSIRQTLGVVGALNKIEKYNPDNVRIFGQNRAPIAISLQIFSVLFAIIDFFQVPLIYLAALLRGDKVPVSKTKNARWGLATVIAMLTLISIAVPAAGAIISLIVAAIELAASAFLFGRIFYIKNKLRVSQQKLRDNPLYSQDPSISLELEQIEARIKRRGSSRIIQQSINTIIASLILVGVVLVFISNPIGWLMLAVTGLMSAAHVIGRLVYNKIDAIKKSNADTNIKPTSQDDEAATLEQSATSNSQTQPIAASPHSARFFTSASPKVSEATSPTPESQASDQINRNGS